MVLVETCRDRCLQLNLWGGNERDYEGGKKDRRILGLQSGISLKEGAFLVSSGKKVSINSLGASPPVGGAED